MKFAGISGCRGLGQIAEGMALAVLGMNLLYRFWTLFDYSRLVGGLFIFLGLCSLVVILFPRLLRAFVFLFGASFFLFGFRGYDVESQVFETVVVFVAVTVCLANIRNTERGTRLNLQLVGLMLCYIGLSALSVQLLPVGHIVKDFWLFGLKASFLQVANALPDSWLYPLAGLNRLLLFFVFALEAARGRDARELFKWIFVGIFIGGVFCAFVGLLDYYGVIFLSWYRLGTVTTPGALHSTFLNRGWFAEFILMVVPFVLIGFMSKIKGVWWKILLLGSLVLCEIALILAGARAGWVSYPLILFICWVFFYFSKEGRLESFQFRWRDIIKVAVSVPITIAISFLLIFWVLMPLTDKLHEKEQVKGISSGSTATTNFIKGRAEQLVKPGGRVPAWMQGFDVGRESPLFGMGYESFCWHANILSGLPDAYYTVNIANKFNQVLDTPHNIFFQLFVSGGVAGLCFWALVIGYSLMILTVDLIRNQRLLNIPVIISIISFHAYGVFQSMQYIPMIWMFIFLNLGYAMTLDEKVLPEWVRRVMAVAIKVMVCVVLIGGVVYFVGRGSQGLAEKYGLAVYGKDQDWHRYHGFYQSEKGPSGDFRWSGKRALIKMDGGGFVEMRLDCQTPGVEKEPVTVDIRVDDEPVDRLVFEGTGSQEWRYWVNREQEAGGKGHEILIEVSRTWNPKKLGISADERELGVAVGQLKIVKEMPKDGVGFYAWEMLNEQTAEWMAQNMRGEQGEKMSGERGAGSREQAAGGGGQKTERSSGEDDGKRFRWTGRRASMPIARSGKLKGERGEVSVGSEGKKVKGLEGEKRVVFLRCGHPDIDKSPVGVKVLGDGDVLRELTVGDHGWKQVVLSEGELGGKTILTFEVSRTWNPKAMGVSKDNRDLGVAVTIP